MYTTYVSDDYNNLLSINNNCTNNDNNIEIIIPLITKIQCSLSFICLMFIDGVYFNQTFNQ